jgi:hypothetical protein
MSFVHVAAGKRIITFEVTSILRQRLAGFGLGALTREATRLTITSLDHSPQRHFPKTDWLITEEGIPFSRMEVKLVLECHSPCIHRLHAWCVNALPFIIFQSDYYPANDLVKFMCRWCYLTHAMSKNIYRNTSPNLWPLLILGSLRLSPCG